MKNLPQVTGLHEFIEITLKRFRDIDRLIQMKEKFRDIANITKTISMGDLRLGNAGA